MKIIADNPIVYSNAFGDNIRSSIASLKDSAKGFGSKLKGSGVLDTAKMVVQTFGKGGQGQQRPNSTTTTAKGYE